MPELQDHEPASLQEQQFRAAVKTGFTVAECGGLLFDGSEIVSSKNLIFYQDRIVAIMLFAL